MKRNLVYMLCTSVVLFSLIGCNKGGVSDDLEIVDMQPAMQEDKEKDERKENTDINEIQSDDTQKNTEETKEVEEDKKIITCYICGAVEDPGVYELQEGSRIYDVIERAEGFKEHAEETYLNQAELLIDGQMIYVPTQDEVESGLWQGPRNADNMESNKGVSSSLVNINIAAKEELMTLTGIGEAKAESIIEYRETQGSFTTIEDIQNIPGIKAGVFNQIKDEITT